MVLRPWQGHLRLVFRLFKSRIRINNLNTCLRFLVSASKSSYILLISVYQQRRLLTEVLDICTFISYAK